MRFIALLSIAILVITGCSSLHSVTKRYDPSTGKLIESTHATGMTFFDAKAAINKFVNRSSPATNANGTVWAPGTYTTGVDQSSSGSNVVVLVISGAAAVVQGAVQGAK